MGFLMYDPTFPVVELHRHLDGNINPKTIWDLAEQFNLPLPAATLEEFLPHVRVDGNASDLMAFLHKLEYGVSVLATPAAVRRVAYENIQQAKESGIDYIELRFSPYFMAKAHQLPLESVIEAVIDGVTAGVREFAIKANLIGILSRTFGVESCMAELRALLHYKHSIVALDLAGDEQQFPADLFVPHFDTGRNAGWHITVHAGEADGPQSVWAAIKTLGATRIGHACSAVRDPRLLEYMAKQDIAVESCLTSNLHTNTIVNLTTHPIRVFLDSGLMVSLSTDDPAVSNIHLAHEFKVAKEIVGLTGPQLLQLQRNALHSAFLSDAEKRVLTAAKIARQQ